MDQRTTRKLLKYLLCVFISCNFASVDAQCTTVSSNEDPSKQICASLHIYKDNSYSQRVLNPSIGRGDWIFAGVVSEVPFDFYQCWLYANETGARYSIFERGCPQEATYYTSKDREDFFKFYGKFMQFATENENTFFLRCNITSDCPVTSGCELLCTPNPPRRYLVESVRIGASEASDGGSGSSVGVNYIIILVVVAVVFLILFIILLVVLFFRMRRKRRRRRQARDADPVLINTTIPPVYQNGHVSGTTVDGDPLPQPAVPDLPTYASVNKEKKNSRLKDGHATSEC